MYDIQSNTVSHWLGANLFQPWNLMGPIDGTMQSSCRLQDYFALFQVFLKQAGANELNKAKRNEAARMIQRFIRRSLTLRREEALRKVSYIYIDDTGARSNVDRTRSVQSNTCWLPSIMKGRNIIIHHFSFGFEPVKRKFHVYTGPTFVTAVAAQDWF